MPLARASIDHLTSAVGPAILCLGILLDEAVDSYVGLYQEVKFPIGRVLAGALFLVAIVATERTGGIVYQFDQIARGMKAPATGPRYSIATFPERATSTWTTTFKPSRDSFAKRPTHRKTFTLLHMMDGGELDFLCDRANPTRYDLPAEIMTAEQQREVLESLKSDPPVWSSATKDPSSVKKSSST